MADVRQIRRNAGGDRAALEDVQVRKKPGGQATTSGLSGGAPEPNALEQVEQQFYDHLKASVRPIPVGRGGSFASVAKKAGVHVRYVRMFNPGVSSNSLQPTDELMVPTKEAIRSMPYTSVDLGDVPELKRYPPGSPEWTALFQRAAALVGRPQMAQGEELKYLKLVFTGDKGTHGENHEGDVMKPVGQYGSRAMVKNRDQWPDIRDEIRDGKIVGQDKYGAKYATRDGKRMKVKKSSKSSAIGLGQLLGTNYDAFGPAGKASIGDPLGEAITQLRYIIDHPEYRGSPKKVWLHKQRVSGDWY